MKEIKSKLSVLSKRFGDTMTSPSVAFPLGIMIGLVIGIVLTLVSPMDQLGAVALLAGAILSVVIERAFDFSRTIVTEYMNTHPLRKLLGSIVDESAWIYISPFYRDMDQPDEFKLFRYDRDMNSLEMIVGPRYLYGQGDALAMSFSLRVIEKVAPRKHKVYVGDDWRALEHWGRDAICIGAHNAKTREILDKFDHTFFNFSMNYQAIVKAHNGSIVTQEGWVPAVFPREGSDSSMIDYGIILKLQDQFDSGRSTIILIAGIGDQGTAGAAYFLLTRYEELPYDESEFGVLIEIPSGYQSARIVDFEDVSDYIYL